MFLKQRRINQLIEAVYDGDLVSVREMAKKGVPLSEESSHGERALSAALETERSGIALWLIRNGAVIRREDVALAQETFAKGQADFGQVLEAMAAQGAKIRSAVVGGAFNRVAETVKGALRRRTQRTPAAKSETPGL